MLLYNEYKAIGEGALLETRSVLEGATDSCAFRRGDTLTFIVRVPRAFCAFDASFLLYNDADMSEIELRAKNVEITLETQDEAFGLIKESASFFAYDSFFIKIAANELCEGLYYHHFAVETIFGRLYISRDGSISSDKGSVSSTQLTIFASDFHTPDRFKGKMMYQIFPDRFARGREIAPPPRKAVDPNWSSGIPQYAEMPGGEVANDKFFGGDLYGIAEGLDYIKSLGVDILYLCPIFEAASNHRYDTGDYFKVDSLLGGEKAFDHLLSELKKRDMKLILDGVFNHTGADSKYFNKFGNYPGLGAYGSKHSKYYKWYTFEEYPEKYRCWWGVKILPALKSDEPSYREFICGERGVIRHYLKKGIGGWRLDVADELSDTFLDELRRAAKSEDDTSLILGEVWEDASNKVAYDKRRRYFTGHQLDSVMNYPLKEGVIDFILTRRKEKLVSTAKTIYSHYPREVGQTLMNLLGTHDTERILSVLADVDIGSKTNPELAVFHLGLPERQRAIERLKLAWALICAFPGIPCIYYGDEAGMEGGRDPFNRMPFVPENADIELTHFYRQIGNLRREERVFALGDLSFIETGDSGQLLIRRSFEDETIIVAANLTYEWFELEFDRQPEIMLGNAEIADVQEKKCFCRALPMSVEYFRLRSD